MNKEMISKIELEKFSNELALEMAMEVISYAKQKNQNIAIEISRLNHSIFLFVGDKLPADRHNLLRRKANVAKHFKESSLTVKNDLISGQLPLEKTFSLDQKEYLPKGGAIPIFVKNAGMVATITVSGLSDEEDHKIIIDALSPKYF